MGGIWIFGGTSEGRRLAAFCEENGFLATVSVATEYGEQLLSEGWHGRLLQGRMGEEQMREYLKDHKMELVLDATHPFASEATANIRRACEAADVEYIRLLRENADREDGTVSVGSVFEAIAYLEEIEGNIMLTTGSKDLPAFCERLDPKRLYPRVLPSVESLGACLSSGIPPANCIAMQGPFSEAVNVALLEQFQCACLVTKESGTAGGLLEKLSACKKTGTAAVVIRRPYEEDGLELEAVCAYLKQRFGQETAGLAAPETPVCAPQETGDAAREQNGHAGQYGSRLTVDIVGIGMGTEGTLTADAKKIIRRADVLIGGSRLLEPYANTGKLLFDCYQAEEIRRTIGRLAGAGDCLPGAGDCPDQSGDCPDQSGSQAGSACKRIAVLMSGDVGFYSGAKKLLDALSGYGPRLCPGISSVVYMAAKIGAAWQDMALCSAHGREQNILAKIRHHKMVFLLAGNGGEILSACGRLVDCGMDQVEVFVGENLSYANERIWHGSPLECLGEAFGSLAVAVFVNHGHWKPFAVPGIPDEAFARGNVPMTKEEIRAVSLSKLRLARDSVVYDIGAGTGSVSIEAALAAEDGMVYAVEKKAEAAGLIEENALKFRVGNLRVVRGTAPGALDGLPAPTHAFIGGSQGSLKDIITALQDKNPNVRIVMTAISLETIAEMAELSKRYQMELAMVTVAKANPVGSHQLMMGQNPVMIGTVKGGRDG